jgi:hypothetical protein
LPVTTPGANSCDSPAPPDGGSIKPIFVGRPLSNRRAAKAQAGSFHRVWKFNFVFIGTWAGYIRVSRITAQQLRDEWRRLHRGQPPRLSHDLLIRTIAYRVQELVHGGLSKASQRKLDALTKELQVKGNIVITPNASLRPGTRLVREWRGRTHMVVVKEDGFEYAGKTFPSLTNVAHSITGAHWSPQRRASPHPSEYEATSKCPNGGVP